MFTTTSVKMSKKSILSESKSKSAEIISEKSYGDKDELTSIFLNFMLDEIIEKREIQTPSEASSSLSDLHRNLNKIPYKDLTEDDVSKSEILGVLENNVLLKPKEEVLETSMILKHGSKANKLVLSINESRTIHSNMTLEEKTQSLNPALWSISFHNGNKYLGELKNGIMHGTGTFTWADGTIYEGTFMDGFPTGTGKMVLPDLATYEGDFFKGEFHGHGTLNVINTSMVYSGNWKDGQKNGFGWLLYKPKDWYEGNWDKGQRNGFGFRQYSDKSTYEGNFLEGVRSGKGMMLYSNYNFYKGTWQNSLPHGYGEYFWNTFINKSFVYPIKPWFKGTWSRGLRHGAGVINFGSDSGAKLAGIWHNNLKHGPGVMICGNGFSIQKAPLFLNDKAVLNNPTDEDAEVNYHISESDDDDETLEQQKQTFHDVSTANSYPDIIKEINKKIPMDNITPEIVENMKTQRNKPELNPVFNCNQLETPIHASPENVDLNFYIDNILQFSHYNAHLKTYAVLRIIEQTQMSNTITNNLTDIKRIYQKYTEIATDDYDNIKFPTVMTRMFLWQLYRDVGVTSRGISLFETDLILSQNPQSCVETSHDPFEPIYFWQFIQSLVGMSILLYKKGLLKVEPKGAMVSSIFKEFLMKEVLPNINNINGKSLKDYKDLLPFKKVFSLYESFGDHISARSVLNNFCVKKGCDPPCYVNVLKDTTNDIEHKNGKNVLVFDEEVEYIKEDLNMGERVQERESLFAEDSFKNTLFSLRSLGPRKILACICKVCPAIKKDRFFVNMDYPVNFLEFYEILLLCAETLVRVKMKIIQRKKLVEELLLELELNPPKPVEVETKQIKKKK